MKNLSVFLLACILCLHINANAENEIPPSKQPSELKEELSETHHTLVMKDKEIPYKAVAGTMILKDKEQKPKASIFYTAYIKEEDDNPAKRPITFCFNGGPGSSAVWLHIGVFGPKKIKLTEKGIAQPPYQTIDNVHSLLDMTDLVFIDPVSTGHSRAAPGEDPKQFHGVEEDINSVAEFIRLYTTKTHRWASPKFIAGESYGTTRAAGLAGCLHKDHYMPVDGVILLSSVLDFQTILDSSRGNDLPYLLYLPTYTAAAWYHQKLPSSLLKKPLHEVLQESERFAISDYSLALLKGRQLNEDDKKQITAKLAYYTGLSEDYIRRSNLRINIFRFCRELLRDQDKIIGRFDCRLKGMEADGCGECILYDPSAEAIMGGFTAAFNHYLTQELEWERDEPYKVLTHEVRPWDFGKTSHGYLSVAETLREVMTRNPRLQVFVASGYYDLATPYFGTDYTIDHLGLDSSLTDHITTSYYEAGHMMYTHNPSLIKLKSDLKNFYEKTIP